MHQDQLGLSGTEAAAAAQAWAQRRYSASECSSSSGLVFQSPRGLERYGSASRIPPLGTRPMAGVLALCNEVYNPNRMTPGAHARRCPCSTWLLGNKWRAQGSKLIKALGSTCNHPQIASGAEAEALSFGWVAPATWPAHAAASCRSASPTNATRGLTRLHKQGRLAGAVPARTHAARDAGAHGLS